MKNSKKGSGGSKLVTFSIVALLVVVVIGVGAYINSQTHWIGGGTFSVAPVQPPSGTGCSVALSYPQTPVVQATDKDSNTAIAGTIYTIFSDPAQGIVQAGVNSTTNPGHGYTALVSKSGYAATHIPFSTSCTETSPAVAVKMKVLDSSITGTVYNAGGSHASANAVTSTATRQTLTANSPTTMSIDLAPSAVKKHISGESNQFVVYFNTTNGTSAYDQSGGGAALSGNVPGFQGSCIADDGATPAALGNNVIYKWKCTGDFDGNTMSGYTLSFTVKPSSSWGGGNVTAAVCVVPVDYFKQVNANGGKAANSVQTGGVKDDGSAIQTAQCFNVFLA